MTIISYAISNGEHDSYLWAKDPIHVCIFRLTCTRVWDHFGCCSIHAGALLCLALHSFIREPKSTFDRGREPTNQRSKKEKGRREICRRRNEGIGMIEERNIDTKVYGRISVISPVFGIGDSQ